MEERPFSARLCRPLALLVVLGRGPNIVKSKCSQGICTNISFLMGGFFLLNIVNERIIRGTDSFVLRQKYGWENRKPLGDKHFLNLNEVAFPLD